MIRFTHRLGTVLIAAALLLGFGTAVAQARPDAPNMIKVRHSGQCLTIEEGGPAPYPWLVQWYCQYTPNQQWYLEDLGSNVVRIVSALNGRCVEVYGNGDGAPLTHSLCNGTLQQRWLKVALPGGYFQFKALHSFKCMQVEGASLVPRTKIVQWTCTSGAAHQEWTIV